VVQGYARRNKFQLYNRSNSEKTYLQVIIWGDKEDILDRKRGKAAIHGLLSGSELPA
jgi:hypothetical protein